MRLGLQLDSYCSRAIKRHAKRERARAMRRIGKHWLDIAPLRVGYAGYWS